MSAVPSSIAASRKTVLAAVNASRYAGLGRAPTVSDTLVEVRRLEA